MYELLGISLVLTALLSINAGASALAAGLWRLLERPLQRCGAHTRAEILFLMRVGPPTVALILVAAFLIPSYLAYEPYASGEFVSNKLGALALLSAVGVTLALWRGVHSWLATRSLLRRWLGIATPITLTQINIPTFRLPHSFPIIAVVGTARPRLFIAERVLESLTEDELVAAIAHECGHLAARDNLKRMLMRACRDMLAIVPCGRSIDRAWAENAEAAADEHAAERGSAVALNLASALIEIARMVPAGARPTMPAGAFLLGDDNHGVPGRVNRLIALAGTSRRRVSRSVFYWTERLTVLVLVLGLLITLTNTHVLVSLHNGMERIVQLLT
jgi:Zn-dependent protease with chaperone function